MAYGFNDDKSKFDITGLFVVIEGNVSVAGNSVASREYTAAQLRAYGVDDIADYAVISAMAYASTQMLTDYYQTPNKVEPPLVTVMLDSSGGYVPPMTVNVYNHLDSAKQGGFDYRIVLMKIA